MYNFDEDLEEIDNNQNTVEEGVPAEQPAKGQRTMKERGSRGTVREDNGFLEWLDPKRNTWRKYLRF